MKVKSGMKLVSIIITTYNATNRLRAAINSVLNQNYTSIEVIVVDDNDPDTSSRAFTETLMSEFSADKRVFYVKHLKNQNGSAARNTGIAHSKGEYICFLDDDDEYYPERIAKCVDVLEKQDDYAAIYTAVDIVKDEKIIETRKTYFSGYIWKELLLNEGLLGTGSNLFLRKSVITDINGFDTNFIRYQDVEFMLRVSEKYKVYYLDEVNKLRIFKKFSYLINRLDEKERLFFYREQYFELLNSAIISCDHKLIQEAMKNYKKYGYLSFKTRIKCIFPSLYKRYLKRL